MKILITISELLLLACGRNLLLTYIPTYQYMNIHPVIACEHRSAVHLPAKTTAYIKEDALHASILQS